MRCFLAIELNEEMKGELVKIQKEFQDYLTAKFVEKENLHLTLKFFPDVDEKDINDIKKSLKELEFGKFSMILGKIGFFPNENRINVVWASLESEKIGELHELIEVKLTDFVKEKNFESHVTLARVKNIKNKEKFLEKVKNFNVKPVSFEVKNFILKKSTLTEKGPIYEDIERFELF